MPEQTIHDIVSQYAKGDDNLRDLEAALYAREDSLREDLALAATQFSMYPEIVAKVLDDFRVGSPHTEAESAYIQKQFTDLMTRLADEYRRMHGDT
jgi:hypothetical protein